MTNEPSHPVSAGGQSLDLDLDIAIIACNNALTIARTIESVTAMASRIIVVDSGSTDDTVSIATRLGAEVVHHAWEGHVKQKQFALEQCTATWVLSLDSDEAPEPELLSAIASALQAPDEKIIGYEVNRRIFFHGAWLKYTFQPEWRLRLVRRQSAYWGGFDPHDQLVLDEKSPATRRLHGILRHDSWQDVSDLLHSQIKHGLHAAESYHQAGRRATLLHLFTSPISAAIKQIILRRALLDGWRGIVCGLAAATGVTAKYLRLLELQKTENSVSPPPLKK